MLHQDRTKRQSNPTQKAQLARKQRIECHPCVSPKLLKKLHMLHMQRSETCPQRLPESTNEPERSGKQSRKLPVEQFMAIVPVLFERQRSAKLELESTLRRRARLNETENGSFQLYDFH
jgi:hypothetical protein